MGQQAAHRKPCRSRNAAVGGVCAGLAESYDLDPLVVRILVALASLLTVGAGSLVYLALWAALPLAPEAKAPYEVAPQQAESSAYGALDMRGAAGLGLGGAGDAEGLPIIPRLAVAVCLMLLFVVVSAGATPLVSGSHWWQFWPLAWLICGLCLVIVPIRSNHEAAWHAAGLVLTSASAAMLPMSLGAVSWGSVPYAFQHAWPLVLLALVLFAAGFARNFGALMIAGAFVFAAFCLVVLAIYALPGYAGAIVLQAPDGNTVRLAVGMLGRGA